MRILVTGGNGFLGRAVIDELLSAGYSIRALQRSTAPELEALGVEVHRGSITDREVCRKAVESCDAVVHCAAKAGVWGKREDFFSINLQGTINLLDAAQGEGIRTFLYTSTPSVVFSGEPFRGDDESLPYGTLWLNAYSESKAMAEARVLAANCDDFQTCALRPHLIWGDGDTHLVPMIVDRGRKRRLRRVGKGENRVDMTHVVNAARGHAQALEALNQGRIGGKAYFLSDGDPVNLWSWIDGLFTDLNIPSMRRPVSFSTAYRLGGICEFFWKLLKREDVPPMTRFVAVELAKDHWFSIEAARRDFGYNPSVDLSLAYTEMLENLRP